jgi:hypothetical protein
MLLKETKKITIDEYEVRLLVIENLSKHYSLKEDAISISDFVVALDIGMGFPISKMLAGEDIGNIILPPALRVILMKSYSNKNSNNFGEFINNVIYAAAGVVISFLCEKISPIEKFEFYREIGYVKVQEIVKDNYSKNSIYYNIYTSFKLYKSKFICWQYFAVLSVIISIIAVSYFFRYEPLGNKIVLDRWTNRLCKIEIYQQNEMESGINCS